MKLAFSKDDEAFCCLCKWSYWHGSTEEIERAVLKHLSFEHHRLLVHLVENKALIEWHGSGMTWADALPDFCYD